MANGKAWFGRTFGKYLFEKTTISKVEALGTRFRRLDLVGPTVATTNWSPGDKVQVFVGDDGMRTYTPFDWDRSTSTVSLLVLVRDQSAGSRFGRDAKVGDAVEYFGPSGSLALDSLRGPVILFGDETSLALAASLTARHPNARAVLEVDDVAEVGGVAKSLAITGADFVARAAGSVHLDDVAKAIATRLLVEPSATVVWSGRAKSIQTLRKKIDAQSTSPRKSLSKAYWADGRVALD